MRTSTFVMIGFAVLFGLLAVFLAQVWINNTADQRLKSLEAQRKPAAPSRTLVVARKPLRFGEEITAAALREVPWPQDALPAGAFSKISEITSSKRVVLMPIDPDEPVLASKITGPGQRATLSAMLSPGMTAVSIRVNDVEGVAGFVLPGDRVDVVLTRQGQNNSVTNDVVLQDARVLAIDQVADLKAERPAVVKTVTLEVSVLDGQKIAMASTIGTLSLLLRKAGDTADAKTRQVTQEEIGHPAAAPKPDGNFVTIGVIRPSGPDQSKRQEYKVPVESGDRRSMRLPAREAAQD